jgi:hypothetical protein
MLKTAHYVFVLVIICVHIIITLHHIVFHLSILEILNIYIYSQMTVTISVCTCISTQLQRVRYLIILKLIFLQ